MSTVAIQWNPCHRCTCHFTIISQQPLNSEILKCLTFSFQAIDNGNLLLYVIYTFWHQNCEKWSCHKREQQPHSRDSSRSVIREKNDKHNVDFKANDYAFKMLLLRSSLSLWIHKYVCKRTIRRKILIKRNIGIM